MFPVSYVLWNFLCLALCRDNLAKGRKGSTKREYKLMKVQDIQLIRMDYATNIFTNT
jgi:hypothetical protein